MGGSIYHMTKRILLLGELCKDVTVIGPVKRIAPEAPIPIQSYARSETNPGMAGNVRANLESMWPGVPIDFVHQTKAINKIRHIDEISGQQLLRVDDGDDSSDHTFEARVHRTIENGGGLSAYCACVISSYGKGLIADEFVAQLAAAFKIASVPVWLDTKSVLGSWSKDVTFVKINEKEYQAQLVGGVTEPWAYCGILIVTRGRDGIHAYASDGSLSNVIPAKSKGIVNVCGCGDTVLAALVVAHFQTGGKLAESLEYAARAAAVAVSKPGVVAVTWQEVEALA